MQFNMATQNNEYKVKNIISLLYIKENFHYNIIINFLRIHLPNSDL